MNKKKNNYRSIVLCILSIVLVVTSFIFIKKVKVQFDLSIKPVDAEYGKDLYFADPIDTYKSFNNYSYPFETILQLEIGADSTKIGFPFNLDNTLSDEEKLSLDSINELYFSDKELDIDKILADEVFLKKINVLVYELSKRNNTKYFSQLDMTDPSLRFITCIPNSASILLNSAGLDITPEEITEYMMGNIPEYNKEYLNILDYVKLNYGNSLNQYIEDKKLYQIFWVFAYGMNIYPKIKNSDYKLCVSYIDIDKIYEYIDKRNIGMVISTYLPYLIHTDWEPNDRLSLKGGHAVYIRDVLKLKVIENGVSKYRIIGVVIEDTFGNPNSYYETNDGHGIVIPIDKFKKCIKTEYTDTRKSYSSDSKIRVMYLDKK